MKLISITYRISQARHKFDTVSKCTSLCTVIHRHSRQRRV